jgi:radical SAM superfamily enzyme YgiQ (UPF0313 family)
VKALINAGMDKLIIGIQSGSENVNRYIYNRNISNEKTIEVIESLNRYSHVTICYDFIVMNPFESESDLIQTIQFIKNLPVPFTIYSNSLAFYPGTKLHETALKSGMDVSGRMEYTEIAHGYKILKNVNMRHKLFHFIMLLMGGSADNIRIGKIRRFFISDQFISFYSFLNQNLGFITDGIISIIASALLFYAQLRKALKKILGPKIYLSLRSTYYRLLRKHVHIC